MGYRFKKKEPADESIRRIVQFEIDGAIDDLTGGQPDVHEAIHEARKHFKKIRAVLRLVRKQLGEVYRRENAWFRDAGREFSDERDAQAMLEAFDALKAHHPDPLEGVEFIPVQERLEQRREAWAGEESDV